MAKQFKALLLSQSKKVWRKWLPKVMSLGAIRSTPRTACLASYAAVAASIGVWP